MSGRERTFAQALNDTTPMMIIGGHRVGSDVGTDLESRAVSPDQLLTPPCESLPTYSAKDRELVADRKEEIRFVNMFLKKVFRC